MSEELLSDVGICDEIAGMASEAEQPQPTDTHKVYKGLKVSDKPSGSTGSARVRRNSEGDETQVYQSQFETEAVNCLLEDVDRGCSSSEQYSRYAPHFQHEILSHSTNSESYHDTSHYYSFHRGL